MEDSDYDNIPKVQASTTPQRIIVTSPHVMDPGLVRFQLDNTDIIQSLSMKLRGYRYDPNKQELIYDKDKALMNEDGIELLIETLLGGLGHKGLLLSNFNSNETYTIAKIMMNDTAKLLVINMREFGIKNHATREIIQSTIRSTIMAMLKRPFDQGERRFIKDTTEERRLITEGEKGRGLFK